MMVTFIIFNGFILFIYGSRYFYGYYMAGMELFTLGSSLVGIFDGSSSLAFTMFFFTMFFLHHSIVNKVFADWCFTVYTVVMFILFE